MSNRVVVTGGCGFAGVPPLRRLVERSDDVLVSMICLGVCDRPDRGLAGQVQVVEAGIRNGEKLNEALRAH